MFLMVRSRPRIRSKALIKNASYRKIFTLLGILSIATWAWSFGGDSEPGGGANGMSANKNRDNPFDYYSHLGVVSKQLWNRVGTSLGHRLRAPEPKGAIKTFADGLFDSAVPQTSEGPFQWKAFPCGYGDQNKISRIPRRTPI
jgi:hypothetical protein